MSSEVYDDAYVPVAVSVVFDALRRVKTEAIPGWDILLLLIVLLYLLLLLLMPEDIKWRHMSKHVKCQNAKFNFRLFAATGSCATLESCNSI